MGVGVLTGVGFGVGLIVGVGVDVGVEVGLGDGESVGVEVADMVASAKTFSLGSCLFIRNNVTTSPARTKRRKDKRKFLICGIILLFTR
jgi:hypothetical protein